MYQRIIEKQIKSNLFKGKIIILYGPRQVGKTTLAKKIMNDFEGEKAYFQCDIPSQRELVSQREPLVLKKTFGKAKLVIIDEAQLVENIGVILKTFIDTYPEIQIIATGSSSFDLANKTKESLTGRAFEYMLYPLSLEEIIQKNGLANFKAREELIFRYGLYPGIIDKNEKEMREQLETLQSNTLYKDILALENIRKPKILEDLARYLAFHIGSTITINSIANEIKTSAKTVEKYINLLEKMFVIQCLYGFSRNLNNEIKKGFKAYFVDIGLRNSIVKNHNELKYRDDIGGLFENFWIIERIKHQSNERIFSNKYFWKTYQDLEVDYIEESNGKLEAFECKHKNRSSKSLILFKKKYINSETYTVTRENYLEMLEK